MWKKCWPLFELIERDFINFTYYLSLSDSNLCVSSSKLSNMLMLCCQNVEITCSLLCKKNGLTPTKKHRGILPNFADAIVGGSVTINSLSLQVAWPLHSLSYPFIQPFSSWISPNFSNPSWFDSYNNLKHNGIDAKYGDVLCALAGLLILNVKLREDDINVASHPGKINNIYHPTEQTPVAIARLSSYSKLFFVHPLIGLFNTSGTEQSPETSMSPSACIRVKY